MESRKHFIFLALILGCVSSSLALPQVNAKGVPNVDAAVAAKAEPASPGVTSQTLAERVRLGQARQALEGATNTLQNNLITALTSLANASAIAGQNVSHAAAILVRGLVTNTFSLGGVVAYMPRLIFLDGPTQFIETLRLIRSNQIRVPSDMNGAIDTLLVFAGQVRDSGIGQNFSPFVTFFPNIFAGVGDFLTTLIDSVFTFIAPSTAGVGAGVGGGSGSVVPVLVPGGPEPGAPEPVRGVNNVLVY